MTAAVQTPVPTLAEARRAALRMPRLAETQLMLGAARMRAGHWDHAARAFAAAVRLRPDHADAWAWLGTARLETSNPDGADLAFLRALALEPYHPRATVERAGLLRTRGDVDGALALLRAAQAARPDDPALPVTLAGVLLAERHAAEALALLGADPPDDPALATQWRIHRSAALQAAGDLVAAREAVAAIDAPPPGLASALAARRIALAPRDDPAAVRRQAEAAEAALAAPGETAEARINGHFNLARFWSRQDDRDRAFAHWQAGHDLLRPLQPFLRTRFAAFVEAMEEVFDATRLRDGPRARTDDPSPVFIVGMPRSGTTLAEQILAAHPMIHGAGERSALASAYMALAGDAEMESRDAALRVAGQDQASLTAAGASYLADLRALAPDAARIVDKMPGNFRILGFLALLLPGARVIHCVRDPRDIGFSIFTLRFYGHHAYAHDLSDLGWYIGMHQRLMAHWTAAAPLPILRVHLHDWIDDLRGTTARVLDFIGLPYDAACERFHELDREVRTASREQVRRPVNRAGMGRWRDYADKLAPMIAALQDTNVLPGRSSGA